MFMIYDNICIIIERKHYGEYQCITKLYTEQAIIIYYILLFWSLSSDSIKYIYSLSS